MNMIFKTIFRTLVIGAFFGAVGSADLIAPLVGLMTTVELLGKFFNLGA